MENYIWAKNRQSPSNEDEWIEAYKKAVPSSKNYDLYDIAAVVTQEGINGHGLVYFSDNRSRDGNYHKCYHFIPDYRLRLFL